MHQPLNFWVIGGDPRHAALAKALADDGHTVHTYAMGPGADLPLPAGDLSGMGAADCVLLPLPANDGPLLNAPLVPDPPSLAQVLDVLPPGRLCCAGRVSPELEREAAARRIRMVDYFAREELAVANAVPGTLAV